jgi:succinate dehydrogenase/fumarate reductase flavoprotein subunit
MAAAVAAAAAGAAVTVLEAAPAIGGTTAISGGGIWIPASEPARAAGIEDTPEAGLEYLRNLDLGDVDERLCDAYVRDGNRTLDALNDPTGLRWQHLKGYSDYHAELPGGTPLGRSLEITPTVVAPEALAAVRSDPHGVGPVTIMEEASGALPDALERARRERDGIVTRGRGLIGALHATVNRLGGDVRTRARATRLVTAAGAVVGVDAEGERHDGSVVLASGGFERDPELVRAFLRGPMLAPAGPPSNRGDGLRMGMALGAALGNMSEAWWAPAMRVPGRVIDGAPLYRMLFTDLARPGGLLVDRSAERFVDEAANYNDLGRALFLFDAGSYRHPAVPSWYVFDATRRAEAVGPIAPSDPDPDWLLRADTLDELAARTGLQPQRLSAGVARFNELATYGADDDFGRGSFAWDRFSGGATGLRALREAPFYALAVLPGCLGTKGGLRTDDRGRVLRIDAGEPIAGLYAAGNAAANPFGYGYPGPGATIGPALIFGWRAGAAAASGD